MDRRGNGDGSIFCIKPSNCGCTSSRDSTAILRSNTEAGSENLLVQKVLVPWFTFHSFTYGNNIINGRIFVMNGVALWVKAVEMGVIYSKHLLFVIV